ncbi:hypothetical protein SLEP1_g49546 [Rubroshorea leprosula]|uniref:Uncharacterized protein n=1 Tax=Rubroshorea leprosula TaxID=152421 RepID=A0AAV5LYG2_9ROSI|nr:hypothetical protein SLEP1_g49546 [Rubroshorea leprosula]
MLQCKFKFCKNHKLQLLYSVTTIIYYCPHFKIFYSSPNCIECAPQYVKVVAGPKAGIGEMCFSSQSKHIMEII